MAVIDTSMDMPKGCWSCKYMKRWDPETDRCEKTGRYFEDRLELCEYRQKDCPLRSADEMIAEIEAQKEYEYKMGNTGIFAGLATSLGYIHKYCDKGTEQ